MRRRTRVFGGLVLSFALSLLNLAGAFLALTMLGGLDPWSRSQFVGLFGLLEVGFGLAFIVCPNIWLLPVAEARAREDRGEPFIVTPGALLAPRPGAAAKIAAGATMVAVAAASEGVGTGTLTVALVAAAIGLAFTGLSLLVARVGVARPDLDVLFVSVRSPGRKARSLPGLSLGAVVVQLVANVGVFPLVKSTDPDILYGETMRASLVLLGVSIGVALAAVTPAVAVWRGRVTLAASDRRAQQIDTELDAAAAAPGEA